MKFIFHIGRWCFFLGFSVVSFRFDWCRMWTNQDDPSFFFSLLECATEFYLSLRSLICRPLQSLVTFPGDGAISCTGFYRVFYWVRRLRANCAQHQTVRSDLRDSFSSVLIINFQGFMNHEVRAFLFISWIFDLIYINKYIERDIDVES